jgi:hypothetical protein
LDAATLTPTDPNNYSYAAGSSSTSRQPEISINKTGQYYIELNANATCDMDTSLRMLKYIEANGDAGVEFSIGGIGTSADTVRYCTFNPAASPLIINYSPSAPLNVQLGTYDSVHYTYQASAAPSLKYKWTVKRSPVAAVFPTDYDFISGTTATSAYPTIRFKTPGLFEVTDSFFNNCQNKVATQYVAYRQEVSITGPSGTDTICYNTSYNVTGFSIATPPAGGEAGSIVWSSPQGTFSPASGSLTPVFTPNFGFSGDVTITMSVYAPSPNSCTIKSVNRNIYVRPDVVLPDTAFNTCSGAAVGYTVTVPGLVGTNMVWTASNPTGGVSGYADNNAGSKTINDILTGNGIVVYSVKPNIGTCLGAVFTVTDTVRPIPSAPTVVIVSPTNITTSMCSGDIAKFKVTSGDTTDIFNWRSFDTKSIIGGLTSKSNQKLSATDPSNVDQILTNTDASLQPDDATYCFTITTQYGCKGIAEECKAVTVTPGPNIADIQGPLLKYLCYKLCDTIKHNTPGAAGKGAFTVTSNTTVPTLTPITDSTMEVCGMKPGGIYKLKWTIDPQIAGCVTSVDSMEIQVTDTLPTPEAGADLVFCDADGLQKITILFGTLSRPKLGSEQVSWDNKGFIAGSAPFTTFTAPYYYTNPGTYKVPFRVTNFGACPDKVDTLIIRTFDKPRIGSISFNPDLPSYCQGSSISLTSNFDTSVGDLGYWSFQSFKTFATTNFANGVNPLPYTAVETGGFGATIYSKGWSYGCKDSISGGSRNIKVDSTTIAGIIKVTGDTIVCNPTTVGFNLVGNRGNATNKPPLVTGNGWIVSTNGPAGPYGPPAYVGNTAQIFISATTWVRAIVQNGSCLKDTTPPQRIFIPSSANAAKVGNDTAVCGLDTFRLIGNTPLAGTGDWTLISGALNDPTIYPGTLPGVHTFSNAGTTTTTNPVVANIKNYGVYQFVWVIKNLTCPGTEDTITIINTQPLANNVINPTIDTVCKGTNVSFTGSVPTGGGGNNKYAWERSIDGGLTWQVVGFNANSYTFQGDTTSLIRRKIQSDSCVLYSLATQVVVQVPIVSNVIVPAIATICTNTVAPIINGSLPIGGSGSYAYSWDTANNANKSNNLWASANATAQNYTPGVNLIDTFNIRRIVTSGKCSDTSAVVTVTVNPDAKANFISTAPINNTRCAPYQIGGDITNLVLPNTLYNWYTSTATNPTLTFVNTGNQFAGYIITNGLDSVLVTLVALSTNVPACKTDTMRMWFRTSATPSASFTVSVDSGCSNATNFIFTNTTLNKNLFTNQVWNLNSSTLTNSGLIDLPAGGFQYNPSTTGLDTIYTVKLTVFSTQCGNSQVTKNILVRTKPNVNFTVAPSYQCSGGIVKFYDFSITSPNATNQWIFGDAGTTVGSTAKDSAQHIYSSTKLTTYPAKLIVKNECASDSFVNNVVIAANTVTLNMGVNPADRYKCMPASDTFTSNSTGATDYTWDFGDGNFSPVITNGKHIVVHQYTSPGKYIVKLTGSTTCGSESAFDSVYVYGTPKVAFSINPNTTACIGDTVRLNNLTDTFTSHGWTYGNGNGSIDYRIYKNIGVYPVQLWATRTHITPLGGVVTCSDTSTTQNVTIRDTMLATFKVNQTNTSCLPFDARLIDTTSIPTKPIIVTNWSFGDNSTSVASNDSVDYSYKVLGTYYPSVIIKNAGGCTYTGVSNPVEVKGPTGTWTHTTGYVCGANTVNFSVNGNSQTDSIIVDFGDGPAVRMLYATNTTFTHSYLTGGDKNPSIILKSLNGCEFPINANGLIKVDYVDANYTSAVTQPQPCGSSTRMFTNTSTMDQSPALATYSWVIKTSTITTKDASLTSTSNDTFNVFMQVTSVSGCFDTVTTTQFTTKVNNNPQILNMDRTDSACAGQLVKYAVNVAPSQDAITNYIWHFGNGTTVSGINTQSAETFYGTQGLYSDTVVVVTDKGCTSTLVRNPLLRILNTPTNVSINPGSDQTICEGTTSVTLSGTGAANYYWTPNIALSPKDSSPTVTASPTTFTRYTVHGYNVYGRFSCEDTASVNVYVVPKFNASIRASLNDSICLGDSITLSVVGAPAGSTFNWGPTTAIGTFKDSIMTGISVLIKPVVSSPYTVVVIPPSVCQSPQPLAPINIGVGTPININLGLDSITLLTGSTYQFAPNYGPDEVSVTWTPEADFVNPHDLYPSIKVKGSTLYEVQATSIYGCKDTQQLHITTFCQAAQVFMLQLMALKLC